MGNIMKILIADKIDPVCGELLRKDCEVEEKVAPSEDELAGIITDYDALLVRSKSVLFPRLIDCSFLPRSSCFLF